VGGRGARPAGLGRGGGSCAAGRGRALAYGSRLNEELAAKRERSPTARG